MKLREPCARECALDGLKQCSACLGTPVRVLLESHTHTPSQLAANALRESFWEEYDAWQTELAPGAIGRHASGRSKRGGGRGSVHLLRRGRGRRGEGEGEGRREGRGGDGTKLGWEFLLEAGRVEELGEGDLRSYLERHGMDVPRSWLEMRKAVLDHYFEEHTYEAGHHNRA